MTQAKFCPTSPISQPSQHAVTEPLVRHLVGALCLSSVARHELHVQLQIGIQRASYMCRLRLCQGVDHGIIDIHGLRHVKDLRVMQMHIVGQDVTTNSGSMPTNFVSVAH